MGIRVYADVFCFPLTGDPPNVYEDAVMSAQGDDEIDMTGAIVYAATNDMLGIMKRQYQYAVDGHYHYGTPTGNLGYTISPISDTTDILVGILKNSVLALHTGASIDLLDFKIGTSEELKEHVYVGLYALDLSVNSQVSGYYHEFSDYLTDGEDPDVLLLTGNPDNSNIGNVEADFPEYKDVTTVDAGLLNYRRYFFDDAEGNYIAENFSNTINFNSYLDAGKTYYTFKYNVVGNTFVTYYSLVEATVENGLLAEQDTISYGDYYPIIPLKVDFEWWSDVSFSNQVYRDNLSKFYSQYNLGDLAELTADLIDQGTEEKDEVDDVFLVNGVNVYSSKSYDNEYIYNFFLGLLFNNFIKQSFDGDYSSINNFKVVESQYEYHTVFRGVKRNTITPLPLEENITKIEYSHSIADNDFTINLFLEASDNIFNFFSSNQVKFYSNNVYTINKIVNSIIQEEIVVTGLQFYHIVNVADSNGRTVVVEVHPSKVGNDQYDVWQTFLETALEDEEYTGEIPKLSTIPIIKETIEDTLYPISKRNQRLILFSSFHFYFYGSIVRYVHWTAELRSFIFKAIAFAIKIYKIFTLGVDIGVAIAEGAILGLIKEIGLNYLKNEFYKVAVDAVLGDTSLGRTVLAALQVLDPIGGYLTATPSINLSGSLGSNLIEISKAVIKIKLIKDSLDLQNDIEKFEAEQDVDEYGATEDAFLLENADEFKSRLSSFKRLAEINLTAHKDFKNINLNDNKPKFIYPLDAEVGELD